MQLRSKFKNNFSLKRKTQIYIMTKYKPEFKQLHLGARKLQDWLSLVKGLILGLNKGKELCLREGL